MSVEPTAPRGPLDHPTPPSGFNHPTTAAAEAAGPAEVPIHPALRTVWRVRNLVVALVFGVALGVLGSAFGRIDAALAITAAMALFGFWHAGAAFRRYAVTVLDDGVRVTRGVFWQSETFVPGIRIQHTDVNQGPLDRRWGMAKLVIHTAAVDLAGVTLSGLHHQDALALRDVLLLRGDDGV